MKLKVLFPTSRKIVTELEGFGRFYADEPYEIWIDGKNIWKAAG